MRFKNIILLFLLITAVVVNAQVDSIPKTEKEAELPELSEVPVHRKCRKYRTNEEKKICFNKQMKKLMARHFNLDPSCVEKKKVFDKKRGRSIKKCISLPPGKERVYLHFKINKQGKIESIKVDASHPAIKREAIRVAKKIKRMTPAKIDGKPVKVGYTLPFSFNVE